MTIPHDTMHGHGLCLGVQVPVALHAAHSTVPLFEHGVVVVVAPHFLVETEVRRRSGRNTKEDLHVCAGVHVAVGRKVGMPPGMSGEHERSESPDIQKNGS